MPSEVDLLRSLDDEPGTPSTIDIRRAIATARRRQVCRRAGYAGAAAVTALAVGGASIALMPRDSPSRVVAATPSPSATHTTPVVVAGPKACALKQMPAPDKAPQAVISGMDRTGRYMVGRSYPKGGGYQAVFWDDGTPRKVMMPGDLEENLGDVNSSGTAVGFSFDSRGSIPYAYSHGEVTRLPGVKHGDAYAINDAGVIVGDNETEAPVVWKSLTAAPEKLPVPAGTKQARASDIGEDGTIVGSLDYRHPYVWMPDGTQRELPMPVIGGKPAVVAQARSISNGWVTGMASTSDILARGAGSKPPSADQLRAVRWNLRTGEAEVTTALRDPGDGVTDEGWQIGTDKSGHAVLATSSGTVTLPDLAKHTTDGLTTMANAVSADGLVIAGQSDDKKGVIQPITWRCR